MATPYAEGSQESMWRGLLRPFHGSTFGLGQPDRLWRQAHSGVRFAHYATIDSCPRSDSLKNAHIFSYID